MVVKPGDPNLLLTTFDLCSQEIGKSWGVEELGIMKLIPLISNLTLQPILLGPEYHSWLKPFQD